MSYWDLIAENQIKDAIQRGQFSSLKNEGKPLPKCDDSLAGEQWIANHILEQNDVLPDWLSLRKDITHQKQIARRYRNEAIDRLEELPNRLWPTDARLRRLIDLYRNNAARLNLMIDEHNHRCPSIQHELVRIREDAVERKREEIRRRRATEYAQSSGGERGRSR